MPSQTRFAGAGTDEGGSSNGIAWTNPGNVTADDGSYAVSASDRDGQFGPILRGSNFGFTLPADATVDGIVVSVEAKNPSAPAGRTDVIHVNIVKAGSAGAQDRKGDAALLLTAADALYTYGDAAQLWGEAWTAADVNAPDFGAQVQYLYDPNADLVFSNAAVDYISVTVHFTDNGPVEMFDEDDGLAADEDASVAASLPPDSDDAGHLIEDPPASVAAAVSGADAWGGGGEAASVYVVPREPEDPAGAARFDIFGSCLRLPVRADVRGTLATVSSRDELLRQSVRSILSTRQGERVMLPDYGLPDFAFAVRGVGFAAAVAYFLRSQILKYEPLIETVSVRDGTLDTGGRFSPELAADEHSAALEIVVTPRGSNTPLNMVFPLWEYRA